MTKLVVFRLDDSHVALYLSSVDRVIPAVLVTPLPDAPEIVLGIINLHGHVVPIFDVRTGLRIARRETSTTEQIIIARANGRQVGLIVDFVVDTLSVPQEAIAATDSILPGTRKIHGVIALQGSLLLIHDLDRFLSAEDDRVLDSALAKNEAAR